MHHRNLSLPRPIFKSVSPDSNSQAPPKLSTGSVVSGSGPSIPSPTPAAGRRAGAGSGGLLDAAPVANARSVTLLEEGIGGKDDDDDDVEVGCDHVID